MQIEGNWSWRAVTLFQIIPSCIQIAFIYWVPESPRWLVDKGRNEEALNMLAFYHGGVTYRTQLSSLSTVKSVTRLPSRRRSRRRARTSTL